MEQGNTALLDSVCGGAIRLAQAAPGTVTRVRLQAGDTTVEVEWSAGTATTTVVAAPSEGPAAEGPPADASDVSYICAPMIGTFYRAPAPGEPPFVREGDVVEAGAQVGILEAMKLMNPIEADQPGRVVEVLVADGTPVEYGQRLFAIAPVEDQ